MSDNDVMSAGLLMARIDAGTLFGRAVAGMKERCEQLVALILSRDFESVVCTAREAASMWLTGHMAYHRLLERRGAPTPFTDAARRVLEDRYMTLLELYEQAARTTDVPGMRNLLREFRGTLMAAIAHPPSGLTGEPPPAIGAALTCSVAADLSGTT